MSQVPSAGGGSTPGLNLGIPFAIGFGVLGAAQARRANRFIRESAQARFKSLDDLITQTRIQAIDDAMRISSSAQVEAGRAEAAFGGVTGQSVSTIIGSFASDVASDTAVIRRNREAALESIEAQKKDVSREAGSQLKNPVIAGILAGISGFQAGLSLDASLSQAAQAKNMRLAEQRLGSASRQLSAIDLANAVTLRSARRDLLISTQSRFGRFQPDVQGLRSSVKRFGPVN